MEFLRKNSLFFSLILLNSNIGHVKKKKFNSQENFINNTFNYIFITL